MTSLLVASVGGHLKQLHGLLPRLQGVDRDVLWVTFDTHMSRSLLEGERVRFVDYTNSRDYLNVARNSRLAVRVLREEPIDQVISTGSGIAFSFIPLARAKGIPCHYIESAARSSGPSLTGRALRMVPGVNTYTQYEGWSGGAWRYIGSVFDAFEAGPEGGARDVRRIVVTLGTNKSLGFRRLVERLVEVIPPDVDVLWQTGGTDLTGIDVDATPFMSSQELDAAMREADAVVAHAGIGSALAALEAGRAPILVPREEAHGEAADDHQRRIADELAGRGLAISRRVDELGWEDVRAAAAMRVGYAASPPPMELAA